MEKTKDQLRDEADMLRFQVEQLWKDCKDYRARLSQALHFKREGVRIKQDTIDELRAEIEKLRDANVRAIDMLRRAMRTSVPIPLTEIGARKMSSVVMCDIQNFLASTEE